MPRTDHRSCRRSPTLPWTGSCGSRSASAARCSAPRWPGPATRGLTLTRETVHEALGQAGHPATARPEELTPAHWVVFARALGWLTDDMITGETA